MRAGAIMADPGIAFRAYPAKGEGRSPQQHYECTPFEELAALPVAGIAAEGCFLFRWIPLRSVFLVEPLMRACGWTRPIRGLLALHCRSDNGDRKNQGNLVRGRYPSYGRRNRASG